MEHFTRLMQLASTQLGFSFHPHCKSPQLTHLMFANDVSIFSKAHPPTLQIIMHTLQVFQQYAGLKANHAKSHIVFGGCNTHLQNTYLQITGFQEGHHPLTYLGVPITASKLCKMECRALVEKFVGKIKLWSANSIPFASRA